MSATVASDRFVRLFQYVLAIKYGALALEAVVRFGRLISNVGLAEAVPDLWTLPRGTQISTIAVFVALILWIRRTRPSYGIAAMALVFGQAIVAMLNSGQGFANHYLLQAIVGIFGMLAAGRELTGETERRAWDPVAWLGVAVWGFAGAKKLLHTAYLDGEFLASLAEGERRTIFSFISRTLLGSDGPVPGRCCVTGDLDVATPAALALVVLSVGMVLAEMSPVVVSRIAPRAVVGWLMLGLTVVATSVANEMSFALVLAAFAALWGEGRLFRRLTVVTAFGLAAGYLAGPLL